MLKVRPQKINFNPRSPYGERLQCREGMPALRAFQSTLPLRGATPKLIVFRRLGLFQSTLPLRGATSGVPFRLPDF